MIFQQGLCPFCGDERKKEGPCCQRSRSPFVRGRFFIDPDYHPFSTNINCRLMGTFDTGVESLCAVPTSMRHEGPVGHPAWRQNLDPWNTFLTREEAEAWIICLDKWDKEGLIDWSGDYPLMKGW